ncbi:hypothetical protein, partial [Escherichia coli]|uniref:hypothetical protein n=1 Tax=Escherichia coli TaxID=562 RepID=UPI001BB47284
NNRLALTDINSIITTAHIRGYTYVMDVFVTENYSLHNVREIGNRAGITFIGNFPIFSFP